MELVKFMDVIEESKLRYKRLAFDKNLDILNLEKKLEKIEKDLLLARDCAKYRGHVCAKIDCKNRLCILHQRWEFEVS